MIKIKIEALRVLAGTAETDHRHSHYNLPLSRYTRSPSPPALPTRKTQQNPLPPPHPQPVKVPATIEEGFGNLLAIARLQEGSRFIQAAIEQGDVHLRRRIWKEFEPSLSVMTTDLYTNFILQKFLDYLAVEDYPAMVSVLQQQFQDLADHKVGNYLLVTFLRKSLAKLYSDAQSKAMAQSFLEEMVEVLSRENGKVLLALSQSVAGSRVLENVFRCCPEPFLSPITAALISRLDEVIKSESGAKLVESQLSGGREEIAKNLLEQSLERFSEHLLNPHASNVLVTLLTIKKHRSSLIWKLINGYFREDPVFLTRQLAVAAAYKVYEKLVDFAEDGQLRIIEQFTDRYAQSLSHASYGQQFCALVTRTLDQRAPSSLSQPQTQTQTLLNSSSSETRDRDREATESRTRRDRRSRSPQSSRRFPRDSDRDRDRGRRDRSRDKRRDDSREKLHYNSHSHSQSQSHHHLSQNHRPQKKRSRSRSRSYSASRSRDQKQSRNHNNSHSRYSTSRPRNDDYDDYDRRQHQTSL